MVFRKTWKMKEVKGDLLEGDWDAAFHCANAHCTMGSGVAYYLRRKWPEVYKIDLATAKMPPEDKLGWFTFAQVDLNQTVYNLYGQIGIGNDFTAIGRNCRYDHLYNAMHRACAQMCQFKDDIKIGIPKYMGCCRAGGKWKIVKAMLETLEDDFPVEFIVYDIESGEGESGARSSIFVEQNPLL